MMWIEAFVAFSLPKHADSIVDETERGAQVFLCGQQAAAAELHQKATGHVFAHEEVRGIRVLCTYV